MFKFLRGLFKEPYELALVRWYNIYLAEPDLYGCLQLYYTEEYNMIPVDSINQKVHIVPRFDKRNQFLLNKYMFNRNRMLKKIQFGKLNLEKKV